MRLFGLIGYPLSHSFSKKYFTKKFEREGRTDCRYELFPLESIDQFPDLLQSHPDLEGLNVTIPYKQMVLPYLDSVAEIPKEMNACNCISIIKGKLSGYNTDCVGFEKSIAPLLHFRHRRALVLGNGGAAIAVTFVLKKLGIDFKIVSRRIQEGPFLSYAELNETIIHDHLVIINTTPLGMYPRINEYPSIPYEYITPDHLLYDLVYNPPRTLFLEKGEQKGATIKNGEEMLELQAEESWRIWNSRQLPVGS